MASQHASCVAHSACLCRMNAIQGGVQSVAPPLVRFCELATAMLKLVPAQPQRPTWRAQQAQRGAVQVPRNRVARKHQQLAAQHLLCLSFRKAARAAGPGSLAEAPVPLRRVAARPKLGCRGTCAPVRERGTWPAG